MSSMTPARVPCPGWAGAVATRALLVVSFALAAVAAAAALAPNQANAFAIKTWTLSPSTTQAAGHPDVTMTVGPDAAANDRVGDDLKAVKIDFPSGGLINPNAGTQCSATDFNADTCPASSVIGSINVNALKGKSALTAPGTMYMLTPDAGSVMTFGFVLRPSGYRRVTLRSTNVSGLVGVRAGVDADYGLSATVDNIPRTLTSTKGQSVAITITSFQIVLNDRAGAAQSGPYFVFNPTRCTLASSRATITSYNNVTVAPVSSFTPTGCDAVPFDPSFSASPLKPTAGATTGVRASISVPTGDLPIQHAHVRTAVIDLPQGTSLNSFLALSLPTCTEAQLSSNTCPANSRLGSAAINVPFLLAPMNGNIYAMAKTGTSLSFAFIVSAPGVTATMRGVSEAVNNTIRTSLLELPQAPYSNATLTFESQLIQNSSSCNASSTATGAITGYASSTPATRSAVYACTDVPNVPPSVSISAPTEGQVLTTDTATVQFAASDSDGVVTGTTCALSGPTPSAAANCTSPKTYAGLANGSYQASVTATDDDGASATAVRNFSVSVQQADTVPPSVTITSFSLSGDTASASFQVSDPAPSSGIKSVVCTISGSASRTVSPCSSPVTFSGLGLGNFTLTITATDNANNVGSATRTFTIADTTAPAINITSPAAGATIGTNSVTAQYAVTDPAPSSGIASVTCALSGPTPSAAAPCPVNGPVTYSNLANGSYTFTVNATDNANNSSSATRSFTIAADVAPPQVTITAPAAGAVLSGTSATLSFSVSDPAPSSGVASITCALSGPTPKPAAACGSSTSHTFTGLADGAYTATVTATDNAGNPGSATRSFSISNTTGWTATINTPAHGSTTVNPDFIANFTVTGATSWTAVCTVIDITNNGAIADRRNGCLSGVDQFFLIGGNQHRFILDVTVGSETQRFTSDFQTVRRPELETPLVVSGSTNAMYTYTPTFKFLQTDRGPGGYTSAIMECSIHAPGARPRFAQCGTPAQLVSYTPATALAPGAYELQLRTVSGSGGSALVSFPSTYNFSIGTYSATSTVTFSTSQAGGHPVMDYRLQTPAGQTRHINVTLPDGLAGSLRSFPKCAVADAQVERCPLTTKIGSSTAHVLVGNVAAGMDLVGDIYLTEPYQPGDAAGFSVLIYSSQPQALANVIIPLRVQLTRNGSQMKIVSSEVPTTVRQFALFAMQRDFFVQDFTMHIDGSAGSGWPLLTNSSNCTTVQNIPQSYGELVTGSATTNNTFQATGCASLAYTPTVAQQFESTAAGSNTGVLTTITANATDATTRTVQIFEPPAIALNLPALGNPNQDRCAPAATDTTTGLLSFDPSTCPAWSKVGTVSLSTPLLSRAVTGNVYLIEASPIPRLGLHVRDPEFGLEMRLVGTPQFQNVDPNCTDLCQQQLVVTFSNNPDLPATSIVMDLRGPDRTTSDGRVLSGKILSIATPGDPACTPTSSGRGVLRPWTGGTAATSPIDISVTGC